MATIKIHALYAKCRYWLSQEATNRMGLLGCGLVLLAYLLAAVLMIGQLLGLLGLLFSLLGLLKKPRFFAITGLVLSSYSILKIIYFLSFLKTVWQHTS